MAVSKHYKKFPFQLKTVIVPEIRVSRQRRIPEKLEFQLETGLGVMEKEYPDNFDVMLRLETIDEGLPISLNIMVAASYELKDKEQKVDRDDLIEFVNNSAVDVVWTEMKRVVRHIMVDWGIQNIEMPVNYGDLLWIPEDVKENSATKKKKPPAEKKK